MWFAASVFSTRLRLIAHLTESRVRFGRQPCQKFLNRFPRLPPEEVSRLDEMDRTARADARRKGKTQPLSSGPLKRALPSGSEDAYPHLKRRRLLHKQPAIWTCAPKRRKVG